MSDSATNPTHDPVPAYEAYRKTWAELKPDLDAAIERYRKGSATLVLRWPDGTPVRGAKLAIRQKTHAFDFGCNILPLGQLGDDRNARYETAFSELFNLATTTTTWCDYEPQPDTFRFDADSPEIWRRPPLDRVLEFCTRHGLAMKGQPLLSDHWTPDWVVGDAATWRQYWTRYVREVAARYGRHLKVIDVANELLDTDKRILTNNPFSPNDACIEWAFKTAADVFPETTILELNEMPYVNEARCDDYCAMIERSLARGARIDAIGCQFHYFSADAMEKVLRLEHGRPETLLENYRKLAAFGKPLNITEITIPGACGEALQAEVLANFYRLWFSIPEMHAAIYWNLNDGAAWKSEGVAAGGLVDVQIRKKQAWHVLHHLVHREWRTDLVIQARDDGSVEFRGFYGTYDIVVALDGQCRTFSLALTPETTNPVELVWAEGAEA